MNVPHCLALAGAILSVFLSAPGTAAAAPSRADRLADQVICIRDDDGNWGGGTMGITHQSGPDYWARKTLDLSAVPEDFWKAVTHVRLSAYFCVRDYSLQAKGKANGLNEHFEIEVNQHVHRHATADGFPTYANSGSLAGSMAWHDFDVPAGELVRGPNRIVFRKAEAPGAAADDYLYLGIDNSVPGGNSSVRFGKDAPWRQDKLTVPGGKGEYMVRLYLIRGSLAARAVWRPADGALEDPLGLIDYAGSHGPDARVEWDARRIDPLSEMSVAVETAGPGEIALAWLDEAGKPVKPPLRLRGPRCEAKLSPKRAFQPGGVSFPKGLAVKSVTLSASRSCHPLPRRVDMAPHVARPAGAPVARVPTCTIQPGRIDLANASLRCTFTTAGGRLRLASLYNEIARAETARRPDDCALFLVEVAGKGLAGSRDFALRGAAALEGKLGFAAKFICEPGALEADLSVWIDADELHAALSLANRSKASLDFKVAFPHLAGLAVSDKPQDDYYFYPWGGGIISDSPAVIRRGYGDHAAIYQLMDVFSPARGAGLALRCTDDDGRYKVFALRKHVPGAPEANADKADTPTAEEYKWTSSLPAVPGVGLAVEYLRRTRGPGESFAPKAVAIRAHAGDWRVPMTAYADWCHRVWKFRPHPSRLAGVVNMLAAGWGQSPIFRDGKYRTDFVRPGCDCIELMSWWEWSALGPKATPMDKLETKLGRAKYEQWKGYFVRDPATGTLMFSNNPGDYDGYNRRWGGLPALCEAIEAYRKMGALVTLYTDPLRVDYNTQCGRKWGKAWGVVQPDGQYRDDYDAWRMCLDVADYRRWVADTMGRVLKETGADGIRLDEYGHMGSACFSKLHEHTFAEPGNTQWQREVAESSKLVRQAMDEVAPASVLTTEHPGYDFLMQFIDGCITYDLTVQATPLRPLECNLQRFYFPQCKAYELDHRGADRLHRKRFWNAVASFGSYYPPDMYAILRENADAFDCGQAEPLVGTLAKHVYANRFSSKGKTICTVYNATGHTFAGPAIRMDLGAEGHIFDLPNCREADFKMRDAWAEVSLFLPRDDVACLVGLPRNLGVRRDGDLLTVSARPDGKTWRISLCDLNGQPLLTEHFVAKPVRFDLSALPKGARPPACVKLLSAGLLIDAAQVPAK